MTTRKSAGANGHGLLKNPDILSEVEKNTQEIAKMATFDAGNVLQNWIDITTVDLREFSEMRVFACKYCHGKDHQYMWLSQREFDSKHSQARAGKGPRRQIDRRQQRFPRCDQQQ
ncbi:MAG: phage terminase small subunit [Candidatus Azotimanducaceae bacterium]